MPALDLRRLTVPKADVAFGAVATIAGQVLVWTEAADPMHGSRPVSAAFALVPTVALMWWRRAPFAALVVVSVLYAATQPLVSHDLPFATGFLPIIVLVASAGYRSETRESIGALAVGAAGIAAAVLSEPEWRDAGTVFADVLFAVVPWAGARALREREHRVAGVAAELERVVAQQEARHRAVVADERARIARELHDVVVHSVAVMIIHIGAARLYAAEGDRRAVEPLDTAEETGRQALAELRRLLGLLRADDGGSDGDKPLPPQPGLADLDALAASVRLLGLQVSVTVTGRPRPLPAGLELSAYRIVQEALTNAVKHAHATSVRVGVDHRADALVVTVVDDGHGTDVPPPSGGGHGLVGMVERANLFGGTVTVGPREGGGWRVEARLPLVERAAEALA